MYGWWSPPSLLWYVARDLTQHFEGGVVPLSFKAKEVVSRSVDGRQIFPLRIFMLVILAFSSLSEAAVARNIPEVGGDSRGLLNYSIDVTQRCQTHSSEGLGCDQSDVDQKGMATHPSIQSDSQPGIRMIREIRTSDRSTKLSSTEDDLKSRSAGEWAQISVEEMPLQYTPDGIWISLERNKDRNSNFNGGKASPLLGSVVQRSLVTNPSLEAEQKNDLMLNYELVLPGETHTKMKVMKQISQKKRRRRRRRRRKNMNKEEIDGRDIFSERKTNDHFNHHRLPFTSQRDTEENPGEHSGENNSQSTTASNLSTEQALLTSTSKRIKSFQTNVDKQLPALNAKSQAQDQRPNLYRHKRRADMLEVWVLEGEVAELPCYLNVSHDDDPVQLILWIKEGVHMPIYSYDYRELEGGDLPKETKPDVNSTMAQRTSFRMNAYPPTLLVDKVEMEDAGVYRCRGDFNHSPTINKRVNLTVIVPPGRVRISWRVEDSPTMDANAGIVGPFLENSQPTLICSNEDGWPSPSIAWYEDERLIDDTYEINLAQAVVENKMTLKPLTRGDLGRRLTCLATNTNSTQPATTTVTIEITLGILGVKVEEIGRIWAGERTEVECAVWGSRPPPTIVWWLGPHMRVQDETKMIDEGNLTISVLAFTPTPKEDAVMLICQATNDDLPDQAVQDSRLLAVYYAPVVDIHLGPSLDPERIKEGDDVYFECPVRAKPPFSSIVWKHNDQELTDGPGVLVANMTLVLQKVTRTHAGKYSCEATSSRATVSSPPIYLDVKYTPICLETNRTTFAVARGENAMVACRVNANPANVSFTWSFNNSAEAIVIPSDSFVAVGHESKVNYTPVDEMDYGTLQCRANNSIGMQATPCIYKIIPAGKPDPPHNCQVSDVTISSLKIRCLPGDDGGLNQTFLMQVYQVEEEPYDPLEIPLMEMEKLSPSFSVVNLRPATPYRFVITAINKMGDSRITELKFYTARVPETQQETSAEPTRDREREKAVVPLVILIGAGVVLVPLIVVVAVLVRLKFGRSSSSNSSDGKGDSSSRRPSSNNGEGGDASSTDLQASSQGPVTVDECDPDILSHTPGVTEASQWTEISADIATLPTSLYNPSGEGQLYPPKGHLLGHPPGLTTTISAPQVPYYNQALHSQHIGHVAVLSASSFAQGRQAPGPSIDIQGYPPPFDLHTKQPQEHLLQHPYPPSPFSHICNVGTPSCSPKQQQPPTCSSQYVVPTQFQEDVAQVPAGGFPMVPVEFQGTLQGRESQGTLQRRGSKREDAQRSYSTTLSSLQMAPKSAIKDEHLHQQGSPYIPTHHIHSSSCSSPTFKDSGTLKRQKGKGQTPGSDVRNLDDGNDVKVESTV